MGQQSNIIDLKKEYEEYRFQRLESISEKIWLVWDRESGKLCCLRNISPGQREIYLALSEIWDRHLPHIVQVGGDYVVEEYIKGTNLKEKIQEGYFSKKQLRALLKQLLPTVRKLHRGGIVHRDIKASNILVDENEKYYLIDFDISMKAEEVHTAREEKTEAAGTVEYAPPEQYGYQECDARSDIYSLGVLMNVLLLGQVPKRKTVHGKIGRCIKKCTMLDREDRYQSVDEVYRALFGVRRYVVTGVCAVTLCAVMGILGISGAFREKKHTEDYLWKEVKEYGIAYPCLKEMGELTADEVKGTAISSIEQEVLERQAEEKDSLVSQMYYETEDNVQIALAMVCGTQEKTGYEFLEAMQEIRKDKFGYSSATNTSYCIGEEYNEESVLYYAGTNVRGIWLFMELLCPKSRENTCKKYAKDWIDAAKKTEAARKDWKAWSKYGTGRYVSRQSDVKSSAEKSVEITSVEDGQVLFSITETTVESYQKNIRTSGYIRAWIVDDKADFTYRWGDMTYQGSLVRMEDKTGFWLKLDEEAITLTKEE